MGIWETNASRGGVTGKCKPGYRYISGIGWDRDQGENQLK